MGNTVPDLMHLVYSPAVWTVVSVTETGMSRWEQVWRGLRAAIGLLSFRPQQCIFCFCKGQNSVLVLL